MRAARLPAPPPHLSTPVTPRALAPRARGVAAPSEGRHEDTPAFTHTAAHRLPSRSRSLSPPSSPPPQQSNAAGLVVISEEDTRTLLIHRLSADAIYVRSGGKSEGERENDERWRQGLGDAAFSVCLSRPRQGARPARPSASTGWVGEDVCARSRAQGGGPERGAWGWRARGLEHAGGGRRAR